MHIHGLLLLLFLFASIRFDLTTFKDRVRALASRCGFDTKQTAGPQKQNSLFLWKTSFKTIRMVPRQQVPDAYDSVAKCQSPREATPTMVDYFPT